jgi:hypothetical protein
LASAKPPNATSLAALAEQIWPTRVQQVTITGTGTTTRVTVLSKEGVPLMAVVDDVDALTKLDAVLRARIATRVV